MSETCGNCHPEVLDKYLESIHGKASAEGDKDAPVCTDCHGDHAIKRPSAPDSLANPAHIAATCSKCHEDPKLQRRHGLPSDRLETYTDSYHGAANRLGDRNTANCASCHGAHRVLPENDPHSRINKKNLPKTCGKCHPGAGKNFAIGSVHVVPTPKHDYVIYWVRTIYSIFILGIVGSFGGYIALDLRARWKRRYPSRGGRKL